MQWTMQVLWTQQTMALLLPPLPYRRNQRVHHPGASRTTTDGTEIATAEIGCVLSVTKLVVSVGRLLAVGLLLCKKRPDCISKVRVWCACRYLDWQHVTFKRAPHMHCRIETVIARAATIGTDVIAVEIVTVRAVTVIVIVIVRAVMATATDATAAGIVTVHAATKVVRVTEGDLHRQSRPSGSAKTVVSNLRRHGMLRHPGLKTSRRCSTRRCAGRAA